MSNAEVTSAAATKTVLVLSHRPHVREAIIGAIGRRPAPDVGRVKYIEADSIADVLVAVDAGQVDLCVFDGEAQPTGGMGLSRQLKNEIDNCPRIVIVRIVSSDGIAMPFRFALWKKNGLASAPRPPLTIFKGFNLLT